MSWKEDRYERKRSRDDYDGRDGSSRLKRGRFSDPIGRGRGQEVSTEEKLESFIFRLGEKTQTSIEKNLEDLSEIIMKEMSDFKDHILKVITRCASELAEKTSVYSTLVGILNAKMFEFGEEVVDLLFEELKSSLANSSFHKVKTLVRFLADLANSKVIPISSIISLFDTLITVTYEPGISQLRSDWYVSIALFALPWVAVELQGRRSSELDRILATIDTYMSKRVTTYLPSLQVWTNDRPHPQRDHLELLWARTMNLKNDGWKEGILGRPYTAFESEITGSYSHPLPNIIVPGHTSDSTYPLPSAVFHVFGQNDIPAHSDLALPPIDSPSRYLATELISSTIMSQSSNRKHCALQLNALLDRLRNLPGDYLLAEVLFGLIFQLPTPPHCLVYYGSLAIELCKIRAATFPLILTQLTSLLFSHLDHMNYVMADRFAWWFSYHLSNFKYTWEWNSWLWCLQCSADHPTRWFVTEVFSRCIRLGSYEVFTECVPDPFLPLLPPAPQPTFLYDEATANEDDSPGISLATALVKAIRAKQSVDKLLELLNSAPSHLHEDVASDLTKVAEVKVSVLTQCVLHVGEKTISHCVAALHKFRPLFRDVLENEELEIVCLTVVAQFYGPHPQVHSLVIEKMVRMQVISNLAVVKWIFSADREIFVTRLLWDIVNKVIQRISSSLTEASKDLEEAKNDLKKKSGLEEVAGGVLEEKQEIEWRVMELEERFEEKNKEQQEVVVSIIRGLVMMLSDHLIKCDNEAVDYETTWFSCVLDHLRQLLLENFATMSLYTNEMEGGVFTSDTDPRIMEIYQQFLAIL